MQSYAIKAWGIFRFVAAIVALPCLLMACGGGATGATSANGSSAAASGSKALPAITSFTPLIAPPGVATVFTVLGSNIPAASVVDLPGGVCQNPKDITDKGFTVQCTPGATAAYVTAIVRNNTLANGGWWIGQQSLEIKAAGTSGAVQLPPAGEPIITSITPTIATAGVSTLFTVTGVNIPPTSVVSLASGICQSPTNMTAQSFTTLCTPGATVGSVVATVNNNTPANGGWWIGQQDLSIEALRNGVTALTDTGISSNQCYEAGSDALISCQSPAAMALNSKQDGMVGRDVIHPAVNDGWLGSNYNLMMSTLTVVTPLSTSTTATTDPRCIKDNVTGLTWQRDSSPLAVARNQSNLVVYQVAEDLRRNANANRLCGFTDWRLPTPVELHSLVSYGQTKPWLLIDPDWFGSSNSAYLFLAGTHYLHDGSSIDWTVDFFRGEIYAMEPFALAASPLALRLVRSPELPAWKSYQLSNDGSEVLDLQSGLIWHRCSAGQTWDGSTCVGGLTVFTHESALAYANTQTRWRLPNVKELRSLVEPSRRNPALDSLFFPETFSSPFWSSTPDAKSFANALTVDFNQGVVKSATRSIANAQVRLVR